MVRATQNYVIHNACHVLNLDKASETFELSALTLVFNCSAFS